MNSAQQGCERVASTVASAVVDKLIPPKHSDAEAWATAFATQVWSETNLSLTNSQPNIEFLLMICVPALLKGWSTGAEQVATAEPLSPNRDAVMSAFYRAMGFTVQDIKLNRWVLGELLQHALWSVMVHGDPKALACVSHHPFNLRGVKLRCFSLAVFVLKRNYQQVISGWIWRYEHPSCSWVYYHFGGFKGKRVDTSTLQEIDYGGMLLTTQNIYFGGERTTFRIPYDHVVSFRAHSDGIGISGIPLMQKPKFSLCWKPIQAAAIQ